MNDGPAGFAERGYLVVRGFLEPFLCRYFWNYATMKAEAGLLHKGGRQVPNALSRYGDEAFDALLETMRPKLETLTGLQLHSTYSFFRIYGPGDALKRHHDRAACEISATVNLGQLPEEPWPIFVAGADGDVQIDLKPGDALIYRGIDRPHWRDTYTGEKLVQVFLHYVDRNGPHAAEKHDRRTALMHPQKVWRRRFSLRWARGILSRVRSRAR